MHKDSKHCNMDMGNMVEGLRELHPGYMIGEAVTSV